jgi:hypothetical protein
VSIDNPGWRTFLEASNRFCDDRCGTCCSNQTFDLTPEFVRKAFGDRLKIFAENVRHADADDRYLHTGDGRSRREADMATAGLDVVKMSSHLCLGRRCARRATNSGLLAQTVSAPRRPLTMLGRRALYLKL